jgi:hypothetical protein
MVDVLFNMDPACESTNPADKRRQQEQKRVKQAGETGRQKCLFLRFFATLLVSYAGIALWPLPAGNGIFPAVKGQEGKPGA